jgi:cytochrome-b5 reductase
LRFHRAACQRSHPPAALCPTRRGARLLQELEALAAAHPGRFRVFYVLNTAPANWAGGVGFISKAMIQQHLPAAAPDVMVLSCGPKPMVDAMKGYLDELGHAEDAQFQF